jgi:tripartite-type tricarboxylate transporter receptor subunit TctC
MRGANSKSRGLMYSMAVAVWVCTTATWAQTASTGTGQAAAQTYPIKPVRYVVPFVAGTGNDIVGRLIADRLTRMWGQQVIVDNRGGASGTIGAAFVAKAPPDGYTLLHCNIAPNAISLSLVDNIAYQHSDFAPITRIGMPPNVIAVHPSVPFKSIKDLVAHAKSNPGKLSYTASTPGTSPHLTMELLKLRLKFDIVHIGYKSAAQATSDVIAGQLPINITNIPFLVAPVQAGQLRALAVASAKRQALLPNVPTMQESGVPDFEVNSWYGVCAPAATPVALLDKLNADIHAAMRTPEVERRLNDLGMPPEPTTREEFDKFMRAEIARWAHVIKEAKIPKM